MKIETWLFIISVVGSLFCGLKLKSKCCGKECSFSVEREETDNGTLRSVRIGRISRVQPTLELPPIERSMSVP